MSTDKEIPGSPDITSKDISMEDVMTEIDSDHDGNVEFTEAAMYFLYSRTIWVNAVALIAMFVQSKYGFIIDQSLQTEILLFVNMWLRTKTTKPITWKK